MTLVTGFTKPGSGLWVRKLDNQAWFPEITRGQYARAVKKALRDGSPQAMRDLDLFVTDYYGTHDVAIGSIICPCCKNYHQNSNTMRPYHSDIWTAVVRAEHRRAGLKLIDHTDPHVPYGIVLDLIGTHARLVDIGLLDHLALAERVERQLAELYRLALVGAEIAETERTADLATRAAAFGQSGEAEAEALLAEAGDYVESLRALQSLYRQKLPGGSCGGGARGSSMVSAARTPIKWNGV